MLAGIIVLAVVAGAVVAVALLGSGTRPHSSAAAPNQPAADLPAGDQARGGVGQPAEPGHANATASNADNSPSASPSTPAAANATLVDDFIGTAPDTHRWGLYESTAAKWLKSNIQVHNGELQIIGSGNDATGKTNTSGGLCWCGDGGNRLYGTWEVRARYDAGSGYGQVIGLWPHSDNQADGSLSFADTSDPARQNMHGHVVAKTAPGTVQTTVKGDFTGWHTFKVDWRASYVRMYVDGKIFFDSTTSSTTVTIPKTPMHLIMQQPVGPSGSVPAANASTPARVMMHIDWVKMSL